MHSTIDSLLREQRRRLRMVPWLACGASVATVAGAWLTPTLPMVARLGVSIVTVAVAAFATVALQRRLGTATVLADQTTARAHELRQLASTDPAARAEYAAYLDAVAEMLRTAPRPHGLSRADHTALIALATLRLEAERTLLAQRSSDPPTNGG